MASPAEGALSLLPVVRSPRYCRGPSGLSGGVSGVVPSASTLHILRVRAVLPRGDFPGRGLLLECPLLMPDGQSQTSFKL